MKYKDIKVGGIYRNHRFRSKNNKSHHCVVLYKYDPFITNSLIVSTKQAKSKKLPGLSEKYKKDIYISKPVINKARDLSASSYKITSNEDIKIINELINKAKKKIK